MDLEQFTLSMMLLGYERQLCKGQCRIDYCDRYMWNIQGDRQYKNFKIYTTEMSETGTIYVEYHHKKFSVPFQEILDKVLAYLELHKPTESK